MSDRPVLAEDDWCFVCGSRNPIGLRTSWVLDADGMARARFRPERAHQGWHGIVHGGILASLLDEAMAQRLRLAGIRGMTAELSVRYRKPVPIGALVIAEARIVSERSRSLRLEAFLRSEEDVRYAQAEGVCIRMDRS
jgi:uncharacterized protein (TIGR00369 family)